VGGPEVIGVLEEIATTDMSAGTRVSAYESWAELEHDSADRIWQGALMDRDPSVRTQAQRKLNPLPKR
jgi:hypothetical protein